MCKNLNLIAPAIDENFSAFFNIVSLSPLGYRIFYPRVGFALHFPALIFFARQHVELQKNMPCKMKKILLSNLK